MRNKLFLKEKSILFILLIAISIFTTSCEDDPVIPQEEHLKAIGMVFYTSGIEVARVLRGVTTDTLTAPVNGLSDHLNIKFINEEEKEINPPSTETQTLAWEIGDNLIAGIKQHDGEEGSFEFHVKGLKVGETSIEFFVMHNDHHDFRSGKIPVRIEN